MTHHDRCHQRTTDEQDHKVTMRGVHLLLDVNTARVEIGWVVTTSCVKDDWSGNFAREERLGGDTMDLIDII